MRKGCSNYYQILQVSRNSSREEIRSSFRKLAKKYHPDTGSLDPAVAHRKMFLLLEAYRVLMDAQKRKGYDLRFHQQAGVQGRSYRDNLKNRRDDPYAQALLILYDLLNGNGSEALSTYERLTRGSESHPLSILGFADYLDCLFLLGEAYQQRKQYQAAARHYEEALRVDTRCDYLGRLRPELLQRIRDIYCRQLARRTEPRLAIKCYERLLNELPVSRKDRAFCHKKIAEEYCKLGEINAAKSHLAEALSIHPGIGGTKKIQERLGME